jgi:hypothetical protein
METQKLYKGKISFINFEKHFATIDYLNGTKQKSVNFKTDATDTGKKPHQYRLGDAVSFELRLSDRGDKMTAFNVKYLHNEAIDLLIQKSVKENRFSGYLKRVDDTYFIKEWESYILFPLQLSPWEKPPVETAENEPISFRLLNIEKPKAICAELFSHNYIPEYKTALQHFDKGIDAEAKVTRISPHAVYLQLFNDKIEAKIPLPTTQEAELKEGDTIRVLITHLTDTKIAVKRVQA